MKSLILKLLTVGLFVGSVNVQANNKFAIDRSLGAQYVKEYQYYRTRYDDARKAVQGTNYHLPEFIVQKRGIEISPKDLEILRAQQDKLGNLAREASALRHATALKRNAEQMSTQKGKGVWSFGPSDSRSLLRGVAVFGAVAVAVGHTSQVEAEPLEEMGAKHRPSRVLMHSQSRAEEQKPMRADSQQKSSRSKASGGAQ